MVSIASRDAYDPAGGCTVYLVHIDVLDRVRDAKELNFEVYLASWSLHIIVIQHSHSLTL